MRWILFFLLLITSFYGLNQEDSITRKNYLPIWSFHQKNANIHGLSVGLATLPFKPINTNTNGIKVELFGLGILMYLYGQTPVIHNDSLSKILISELHSERINGIAIAPLGSTCDCNLNGIALGALGNSYLRINGLGIATYSATQVLNGVQIAAFNDVFDSKGLQIGLIFNSNSHVQGLMVGGINLSEEFKGVQIGIVNSSKKTKGIQIGLWNINERRRFPFINWNFKD